MMNDEKGNDMNEAGKYLRSCDLYSLGDYAKFSRKSRCMHVER